MGRPLAATGRTRLLRWRIRGFTDRAVEIDERRRPGLFDFVYCTVNGRDMEPRDFRRVRMHRRSVIRVQRRNKTAFRITRSGVRTIAPFYSG
jgi:hypothetical protein